MVKNIGDLGICAEKSRTTQTTIFAPKPLTIKTVLKSFRDIAAESKADVHSLTNVDFRWRLIIVGWSEQKKLSLIKRLLVSSRECEARFIVRAMQGNLRIGCSLRTVLPALARAVVLTPPGTTVTTFMTVSMTLFPQAMAMSLIEVWRCPPLLWR